MYTNASMTNDGLAASKLLELMIKEQPRVQNRQIKRNKGISSGKPYAKSLHVWQNFDLSKIGLRRLLCSIVLIFLQKEPQQQSEEHHLCCTGISADQKMGPCLAWKRLSVKAPSTVGAELQLLCGWGGRQARSPSVCNPSALPDFRVCSPFAIYTGW